MHTMTSPNKESFSYAPQQERTTSDISEYTSVTHEENNHKELLQRQEKPISGHESTIDSLTTLIKKGSKKKSTTIPQKKDALTTHIEQIMEEGMKDAFLAMTPVQQQEFKIQGEETARKIQSLMTCTKVKIKKIVLLLVIWLKSIPGINEFFIEQEAKIKADKIIALRHHFPSQCK